MDPVTHQIVIDGAVAGDAERSVDCTEDQTLLDAFLRNGVYLPNSCNQGTCGTCKVRLCTGSVDTPDIPDTVLGADDRAAGHVLACQSRPRSAARIVVDTASVSGPAHRLRDVDGTVTALRRVAEDTVAMHLELDEPLEFSAGQYVEVEIPGTGHRRQYSMANTPSENSTLEFHIRRVPGGAATDNWIFAELAVDHRVRVRGPWGDFVHDDATDAPLVLVAGGTGLAPLKAIARQALTINPDHEIHVYHGVRHQGDLYDLDFWAELTRNHPHVRFTPCLSREEWDGRRGYVGDALLEDFASLRGYVGYLCGPPAMVDATVKACKRRRMAGRNINRERYSAAATTPESTELTA
ncbi:2Fe-2S iron-sulfur cluster-binding protein [Gordonia sp. NPDC003950]